MQQERCDSKKDIFSFMIYSTQIHFLMCVCVFICIYAPLYRFVLCGGLIILVISPYLNLPLVVKIADCY